MRVGFIAVGEKPCTCVERYRLHQPLCLYEDDFRGIVDCEELC